MSLDKQHFLGLFLRIKKLKFRSSFGNEEQTEVEEEDKKDPILQYLQKYYIGMSGTNHLDSSTVRKLQHPSRASAIVSQLLGSR